MSFTRTFLDLSTGHLMFHTRQRMEDGEFPGVGLTGEYGWMVFDSANIDDNSDPEAWEADMSACWALARSLKCDYILFDADAPRHPDLPYFED